jgi:hypothetical protein
MILKYKIHYKFYCVVYSHTIMIYLLYTNTRLAACDGTSWFETCPGIVHSTIVKDFHFLCYI